MHLMHFSLSITATSSFFQVIASTGHADIMPRDHPLYAGQAGPRGNRVASQLTREADLILALGNRLAFNSTFHSHDYVSATADIVQVDVEARALGRYFPITLGIQADAGATAEALYDAVGQEPGVRLVTISVFEKKQKRPLRFSFPWILIVKGRRLPIT